jgi:hypothetical protein
MASALRLVNSHWSAGKSYCASHSTQPVIDRPQSLFSPNEPAPPIRPLLVRLGGSSSASAVVGVASFVPFRDLVHLGFRKSPPDQHDPLRDGPVLFNTTGEHRLWNI